VTITPQLVYSYKDAPGTWFISAGATIQSFLEELPDTETQEGALMPRVTIGLERVMSDNISFHVNGLLGVYLDPNVPEGSPVAQETSVVGGLQIGLNLYIL
jgi:hypothetical protein